MRALSKLHILTANANIDQVVNGTLQTYLQRWVKLMFKATKLGLDIVQSSTTLLLIGLRISSLEVWQMYGYQSYELNSLTPNF